MIKKLELITGIIAAILLFLLMMLTFVDVMGRNFMNRPLTGASELTEIMLAAMIFALLPAVALRQEHIVVDLIDMVGGKKLRSLQQFLMGFFGTAMFGLISWRLWILGDMAAGYRDATPSLGIPLAPVIYAMSVVSGITTLVFIAIMLRPRARAYGVKEADDGIGAHQPKAVEY